MRAGGMRGPAWLQTQQCRRSPRAQEQDGCRSMLRETAGRDDGERLAV